MWLLCLVQLFIINVSCETKFYAVPVTQVLDAKEVSFPPNFNPDDVTDMLTTEIQSRILPDKLIESITSTIDTTHIWDTLNKISLGKFLKSLYEKLFPHGMYNRLVELICHHKESNTEAPVEHYTTQNPHPYTEHTTFRPWQKPSHHYTAPTVTHKPHTESTHSYRQNDYDLEESDNDTNSENLKQEPITDDYIEDEPMDAIQARRYMPLLTRTNYKTIPSKWIERFDSIRT